MKRFVGLSVAIAASVTGLVLACSSSPSSSPAGSEDAGNGNPGFDSGGTPVADGSSPGDTGPGTTTDSSSPADGGSCTPASLPSGDGGVPAYTAPRLDQGVCTSNDISTFVTACSGTSSGSTCSTWAQSNATTSCGECLFSSTAIIAPIEVFTIGTSGYLLPSVGACVLATNGAAAASCAAAVDEAEYCVNYVCAQCAAGTGNACVSAAGTGVCASTQSQFETACSAYATSVKACAAAQGTSASMTSSANVICGSGPADASDQ